MNDREEADQKQKKRSKVNASTSVKLMWLRIRFEERELYDDKEANVTMIACVRNLLQE